jgi:hypothetical protein
MVKMFQVLDAEALNPFDSKLLLFQKICKKKL